MHLLQRRIAAHDGKGPDAHADEDLGGTGNHLPQNKLLGKGVWPAILLFSLAAVVHTFTYRALPQFA